MFEISYQLPGSRRRHYRVSGRMCLVGSARNCDLILSSRRVVARHAQLECRSDGLYVEDLGSTTGTWVNRERVRTYGPLLDVDDVVVGDVTLQVIMNSSGGVSELRSGFRSGMESSDHWSETGPAFSYPDNTGSAGLSRVHHMAPSSDPHTDPQAHPHSDTGQDGATLYPGVDSDFAQSGGADPDASRYWAAVMHARLLERIDLHRNDVSRMSDTELRHQASELLNGVLTEFSDALPPEIDRVRLQRDVLNEAVGLGPLEQFLNDDGIDEIMVNNYQEIYLERAGRLEKAALQFSSDRAVLAVIDRIITPLGRRLDESSPIVDARLKDGSRVNAIIPPLALKGPSVTIRKFSRRKLLMDDMVAKGALDTSMAEFLHDCVAHRRNIVISGGTGSGKTTLLNVLSNFIPGNERIVTIEDAAELQLAQPNLVALEARPANLEGAGEISIRDLVRNALRMRPDRIVVGECRGGEAIDMLQAMNTGHDGSLTTVHANNPRDVISRLEVLVLMAGIDLPVLAIREQIASALDIIIQQMRFPCGTRRVTRITEVAGIESGTVQLQDIFRFEQSSAQSTPVTAFTPQRQDDGSHSGKPQGGVIQSNDQCNLGHSGTDGDINPEAGAPLTSVTQGKFIATGFVPSYFETLADDLRPRDLSRFSNRASNSHG